MAARGKDKECVHSLVGTGRKGLMEVKSMSLNKRGSASLALVNTTVFECSKCGHTEEYPDFWEKNFLLPGTKTPAAAKAPLISKSTRKKRSTA